MEPQTSTGKQLLRALLDVPEDPRSQGLMLRLVACYVEQLVRVARSPAEQEERMALADQHVQALLDWLTGQAVAGPDQRGNHRAGEGE